MVKHRTHSVEFKRQVVQEYLGGETLHGMSNRHDLSRNLIRIWVDKFQAGALDEEIVAADLLETYEARIAALERLVGKQALELEFLKGALRVSPRPKSAPISAMATPRPVRRRRMSADGPCALHLLRRTCRPARTTPPLSRRYPRSARSSSDTDGAVSERPFVSREWWSITRKCVASCASTISSPGCVDDIRRQRTVTTTSRSSLTWPRT